MESKSIETFGEKISKINDPRIRRGFLDSFHANLIRGQAYNLRAKDLEETAEIERKYGFNNHADKLLEHPSYLLDGIVSDRYGENLPDQNRANIKRAMGKYGDNHWWTSEDPVTIATYQLFEEILLVDFGIFHKGLETALGRPVFTHEFGLNQEGLKRELFERQNDGGLYTATSEEYKAKKFLESMAQLTDFAVREGKEIIFVSLGD